MRTNLAREARGPTGKPLESGPLKVLVADDEEASRNALAEAVRVLGHSCRVAVDGLEAWRIHQEDPAHVILSDWRMSGMDGVDLCRRARAESHGGYTHFILVTALDKKENLLEGMRAGADDYLIKPVDLDELDVRLRAAFRLAMVNQSLVARNGELDGGDSELSIPARADPLTDAANRLRLQKDLQSVVDRARRYGHRYCAALCDIDAFRSYNDSFRHVAGDIAIRLVSDAIQRQLRGGDAFYPYGGEEFLVLLPEQSLTNAKGCMERVRATVASLPDAAHGGTLARPVTISVGIAELRITQREEIRSWLRRADSALYRAKVHGRNMVETEM